MIESQLFSGTSNVATRSAQFTLGILLFLLKFSRPQREPKWRKALHFPRNHFRFPFHLSMLCCLYLPKLRLVFARIVVRIFAWSQLSNSVVVCLLPNFKKIHFASSFCNEESIIDFDYNMLYLKEIFGLKMHVIVDTDYVNLWARQRI